MATWAFVSKLALTLPETTEGRSKDDRRFWQVKDKTFAWERPLRKSDLAALGDRAPTGDILAVYVPDLETKDAMVSGRREIYFTTPHFDGYAMVLLRLGAITASELGEVLFEAWRVRAPAKLVLVKDAAPQAKTAAAKPKSGSKRLARPKKKSAVATPKKPAGRVRAKAKGKRS